MSKLTKEENIKMKMRTEEREEMAVAKENLWKRFQERKGEDQELEGGEGEAWERIRDCLVNDEEKGDWTEEEKDPGQINFRIKVNLKEGESFPNIEIDKDLDKFTEVGKEDLRPDCWCRSQY